MFTSLKEGLLQNGIENLSYRVIDQLYAQAKTENSYSFWIYTGLIAEIKCQYHYSIDCYTNALLIHKEPFLIASLARSQAGVGQWKNSLSTLTSLNIVDFSSVFREFDLSLTIGFLPYKLQKDIFNQFKENGLELFDEISNLENMLASREEYYINQRYGDSSLSQVQTYKKFSKLLLGNFEAVKLNDIICLDDSDDIVSKLLKSKPQPVESTLLKNAKLLMDTPIFQILDILDGWLTPLEGRVLALLAGNVNNGLTIVEIGSWKGKSSCFLGIGSSKGNRARVYCVDPHDWTDSIKSENTFSSWKYNIGKLRLEDLAIDIRKESQEAATEFKEKIGMLFVDGDHSKESLELDIEGWFPKLENEAYVAFHDAYFPEVFDVLQKRIFRDENFKIVDYIEGLLIVQYIPNEKSQKTYSELVIWLYLKYRTSVFKSFEERRKEELVDLAIKYGKVELYNE